MTRSHYTVSEFARKLDVGDGVTRTPQNVRDYIHLPDDDPERLPAERPGNGQFIIARELGDRWLTDVWASKPNRWHRPTI